MQNMKMCNGQRETFPTPSVPEIDFSELDEGEEDTSEWESVRTQVGKAMEEYGCFKALFSKVPEQVRKELCKGLEELFDVPLETKKLNLSKTPNGGYIGKTSFTPLYESIGIDDPRKLQNIENVVTSISSLGNPTFSKSLHFFSTQMLKLDKIVRRMLLGSVGLEKYLGEVMDSAAYSLRAQRYEGPETTEKIVGLSPHMDNSSTTILYQNNSIDGLDIQTKDGEWVNLKLSSDHFVVMIGECFHAWSNGRWHAPYHRVAMSGSDARFSIGLFSGYKPGYSIKAPEELVDEEHPLLYKPFDLIEFLKLSRAGNNEKPYSTLKDYFGV